MVQWPAAAGPKLAASIAVVLAAVILAGQPAANASATDVAHRFEFSLVAPDDICGPRASRITFTVRNQVLHWTEGPDGRFNVQFTQTGTYHVDFVDPVLVDQQSQYTDSIHHVFTRSQTEVFNETFHDFPDGLRIWQRTHVTVVSDGRVIIERVIVKVAGCP